MKTRESKDLNSRNPLKGKAVFDDLSALVTESSNPLTDNIDRQSTTAILKAINREDKTVAGAVGREIGYIARAVDMVVNSFKSGGRLFYMGAGTSGRLGVLDAAECPPTFGTEPDLVQGIIAGGNRSLIRSREGVEDDISEAVKEISKRGINRRDVVIGITASRRTPFVLEGLREAKRRRAKTVFISCNPRKMAPKEFDLAICPVAGPEVIAGSSRMKAGTAQKMILNMITTAAMIKTGRVYGNRMVDLAAKSEKLKERSKRIIMDVCGVDYTEAENLLKRSGKSVKLAIVMRETGLSRKQAEATLKSVGGFVYKAFEKNRKRKK